MRRPGPAGRVVRAPVSQGRVLTSVGTNRVPSMGSRGRNCVIRHEERFDYVAGLGGGMFEAYKYSVNPGNINVFPWLSAIADRFEKYKFHKLTFRYIPQCATTETGVVSLVFDFDPNDEGPTTMTNALAYHDYTTGPSWSGCVMSPDLVNGDRRAQLNTRMYSVATTELANYDLGNLYVCTEGQSGAAKVGYIEVSYEIEFFIHQLSSPAGGGLELAGFPATDGVNYYFAGTITQPYRLPLSDGENLPIHVETATQKLIFDSPWEGLVTWAAKAVGAATLDTLTLTTDVTHKTNSSALTAGAANTGIYSMIVRANRGQYVAPYFHLSVGGDVDATVNFASAPYDYLEDL